MREILNSYGTTAPPDDPIYSEGILAIVGGEPIETTVEQAEGSDQGRGENSES